MRVRSFDYLKDQILGHKIVKWVGNTIVFDNNMTLSIEEGGMYGNAWTSSEFKDVVLDVVITDVSDIKYDPWEDGKAYGCQASVIILHDKDIICKAFAEANSGVDGRYYSVASFVMRSVGEEKYLVDFVAADDGE